MGQLSQIGAVQCAIFWEAMVLVGDFLGCSYSEINYLRSNCPEGNFPGSNWSKPVKINSEISFNEEMYIEKWLFTSTSQTGYSE